MNLVKLPPGVKVYVGNKCFKGAIPEELCPDKFKKPAKSDKPKADSGK